MATSDSQPGPFTPALGRNRSFWGLLATQFLGAFNDNVFKQLVLLLAASAQRDAQGIAAVLFSVPFLLLSGFAGFLSDRYPKRRIIVGCKIAEIVIALVALSLFLTAQAGGFSSASLLRGLFVILFLMGAHSAIFGPPKYGILPELLPADDLPAANGWVQMTTFLAIIFGFVSAGVLVGRFAQQLWVVSAFGAGIALLGVLTALPIRSVPAAQPGLNFHAGNFLIDGETARAIRANLAMAKILLLSAVFWFAGGVIHLTFNAVGARELGLPPARTSLLAAGLALGIASGCAIAGKFTTRVGDFRWTRIGAFLLVGFLTALSAPGWAPKLGLTLTVVQWEGVIRVLAVGAGLAGGLFAVPLQAYLQSCAPPEQKGRVIGAMNLFNWVGIIASGAYYQALTLVLGYLGAEPSVAHAATALVVAGLCLVALPANQYVEPTAPQHPRQTNAG